MLPSFVVQLFFIGAMVFRGVIAPLLLSSATAVRMSESEDESFPWHHTWCNPFSRITDKTYTMELKVGENEDLIMEMNRKPDSLTLRLVDGHYRVWLPQVAATTHEHDLTFERFVHPESRFDITVDLVRDIRYIRRTRFGTFNDNAPSAIEIQWMTGVRSHFAGGVWYPPSETLAAAQAQFAPNATGLHEKNMTRYLDGRELDSIALKGMIVQDMDLDQASNAALLSGTVAELVGIALDGVNPAMFPTHAVTEATILGTWALHQHRIHYAASDKIFDKLWCHPLYKHCEADGVVVPKDRSCPQTDSTGRMLPPGYDGPTNFMFVSETGECNAAYEQDSEVRTTSQDLIQRVFGADAGQQPECFHLDILPWRTDLPAQWYKLWCDPETGVAGMQSFSNSDCDVNTGAWENVWQLTTTVCLEDQTLGYVAKTRCEAMP